MANLAHLIRARLLAWYDVHARDLPWRIRPRAHAAGERADPYRVWLSEVMLQQTTIAHATDYFLAFTARWPTVEDLASVADEQVMDAWAGLGYYARARNLVACARAIANDHAGRFPDSEAGLLALPGVGAYTAAAMAAIAFDRPTNVVDGNVERVIARLFQVEASLPAGKPRLKALAATLVRDDRPGDWAQALMDLGATICRPGTPLCGQCPLADVCLARASGEPAAYPRKSAKPARPHRRGIAYVLMRDGEVGLVRRPAKGLLGGMLALPTTEWTTEAPADAPPAAGAWRAAGAIEHVFTHFSLTLEVRRAETLGEEGLIWMGVEEALGSLPSLFKKALRAGLESLL